ncbi:MAG: C10 family peptidase, partial [Candidatus Cloacimonadaceae bacterium]
KNDIPVIHILPLQGGGFVLIAADDVSEPILGYSNTGHFEYPITSPEVRYWIGTYESQLWKAISLQIPNTEKRPVWDEIRAERFDRWNNTRNVNPLLSTTWNQDTYYNQLCPTDASGPGGHAYAGCTATAMGQVMKYWSHPSQGTGSNTYTDGSAFPPAYGTISANFGSTTYNWSSMPNNLTSHNTAVATLLFHCGVAVNMDYGVSLGSGALVTTNSAMVNNFGYSSAAQWQWRSSYSDAVWLSMMKGDLDLGRPIIYQGYESTNTTGHSFVMDGYNSSNYFHFNFGWGGYGDGFYLLNSLIPSGTTNDFSYFQWAYYNIFPAIAPAAPTNLTANPVSYTQIDLSWTDNSNNENGFTIFYRVGLDLTWYYLNSVSPNVTTYQHTGLLPATTYAYSVMAYNSTGNSAYAYSTPVTTPMPPAPINLTTTGITTNSAVLGWTELGSPLGWEIEFGPPGFLLGTGMFLAGIPTNPFNLMGLISGTTYDWYVRSDYGLMAYSAWAGPANFTTQSAGLPYPWSENFEAGFVNLVNAAGNLTPWTLNTTLCSEGVQSAHNAYGVSNSNLLVTSSFFDLSTANWPILSFDHIAKTENNYDHCYVEISTDNGITWMILPPHTYLGMGQYIHPLYNNPEGPCFMSLSYPEWGGVTPDNTWWKSEVFDLSGYTGQPNVMLRFRLKSDNSVQQFGWLIDNVQVMEMPQYSFNVFMPPDANVGLGLSYDYYITIQNTGLMPDNYMCSLQGMGAWTYGLYEADGITPLPPTINIPPSGAYTFVVKVTTPTGGVNNFDTDPEAVSVTSIGNGMGYSQVLTTMVLFGDTVNDAIVINSLPFTHSSSTVSYNQDYGPYGDVNGLLNLINSPTSYYYTSTLGSSPDVVYQLTLSAPTMLSIDLLGSTYDTAVALVTAPGTNPADVLLINDDFYTTPVNFVSYVDTGCNAVPAGTYYIIVGGYDTASGNYSIAVTAAPIPVAPNPTVSYDIAADQIVLSWTQNTVMRYNIYSDTDPYGSFSNVIATGVDAASYTIPGIPTTSHFYKVTERFCYPGSREGLQNIKLLPAKE